MTFTMKEPHVEHKTMSHEDLRRRLHELRAKEGRGELTVKEAGEITRILVELGEEQEQPAGMTH